MNGSGRFGPGVSELEAETIPVAALKETGGGTSRGFNSGSGNLAGSATGGESGLATGELCPEPCGTGGWAAVPGGGAGLTFEASDDASGGLGDVLSEEKYM